MVLPNVQENMVYQQDNYKKPRFQPRKQPQPRLQLNQRRLQLRRPRKEAKKSKKAPAKKTKKGGKKTKKGGKKVKVHVKVKITKKQKKSLAGKIVHKLLDFIGCSRRRLSIDMIKNEARYLEDKKVAKKSAKGKKAKAHGKHWAHFHKLFKAWKAKHKKAKKDLKKGQKKVEKKLRELVEEKNVQRRMQIVAEIENHLRNLSSDITSELSGASQIHRRLVVNDSSIRRAFEAIAHHVRENANARRMGFFDWVKKGWNTIKKHVSKAFKHVKKFVKKHIGPAIKWVKKGIKSIGKKAMKLACGALKGICPKACTSVVKTISPLIKNLGIPTKCDASAIKICRDSCKILCKGI